MVKIDELEVEHRISAQASMAVVSDMADGRLRGEEFTRAVESVCADSEQAAAWHMLHLVGDALRSRELAGRCLDTRFAQAVLERVSVESFEPEPDGSIRHARGADDGAPVHSGWRRMAANGWTWSMVGGIGAMGVALAIIMSLGGAWTLGDQSASVARGKPVAEPMAPVTAGTPAAAMAPSTTMAEAPPMGQAAPAVMIRNPRLDVLMTAHRQMGGTSALQKPAGFLRNAAHQEEGGR